MNVAIVGAGRQGKRRAGAVIECGDKIVRVVDTNMALATALANAYNCTASADWKTAIEDNTVDAIIICTPNDTHSIITIAALKAGKNVLCEKPLARNPEEAYDMLKASEDGKSLLKCGFSLRHHPAIAQAKKHIEQGNIGKLLFLRCRYGITGRPDFEKDWRTNTQISGGGELMDQGQHILDLFRWFGGEISEVFGYADTLYWDIKPVEDNAFALLRGQAGHVCMMHVSWTEWKNIFSFEAFGEKGYLKIEGLGGAYGTEKLILGTKDLAKPFSETITEFREEDRSWREEWKEFSSAVKEKRTPLGSAYDGWASIKLTFAIYESSKKGSSVKLDW
jgi:predicted dehydrogenase